MAARQTITGGEARRIQNEALDRQAAGKPSAAETGEKLKGDIDDLLDEIDGVLETNAEDFGRSYVQKGGE